MGLKPTALRYTCVLRHLHFSCTCTLSLSHIQTLTHADTLPPDSRSHWTTEETCTIPGSRKRGGERESNAILFTSPHRHLTTTTLIAMAFTVHSLYIHCTLTVPTLYCTPTSVHTCIRTCTRVHNKTFYYALLTCIMHRVL